MILRALSFFPHISNLKLLTDSHLELTGPSDKNKTNFLVHCVFLAGSLSSKKRYQAMKGKAPETGKKVTYNLDIISDFLISNHFRKAQEGRVYQRFPNCDLRRMDIILLTVTRNPCECGLVLGIASNSDITFNITPRLSSSQDIHKSSFSSSTDTHKRCQHSRPE